MPLLVRRSSFPFLQKIFGNRKKDVPPQIFCKNPFSERLTGVNNDFKVLIDFLDGFGPEASGRHLPEPQTEAASKLERFARGECNEGERKEICEMLRMHPAWMRWIADRVRLARSLPK